MTWSMLCSLVALVLPNLARLRIDVASPVSKTSCGCATCDNILSFMDLDPIDDNVGHSFVDPPSPTKADDVLESQATATRAINIVCRKKGRKKIRYDT